MPHSICVAHQIIASHGSDGVLWNLCMYHKPKIQKISMEFDGRVQCSSIDLARVVRSFREFNESSCTIDTFHMNTSNEQL